MAQETTQKNESLAESSNKQGYLVSAFYKFISLKKEDLPGLKERIEKKAEELKIRGLFLLGTEGVNSTISGPQNGCVEFRKFIADEILMGELTNKDSISDYMPFRAFKLKIKKEIVTLGDTSIVPEKAHLNHITPEEWEEILLTDPDAIVIDTRNWYETEIGKFKKALDLKLNEFNEFPDKLKELEIQKDKKVLIYCTGGIRCEKAIIEMHKQGFENVYQLEGGILKYFEDVKESNEWDGECFVFDRRVAVDKNLEASKKYTFCPHCGQPAHEEVECIRCEKKQKICKKCLDSGKPELKTCSKNCAHHHVRGSRVKRKNQGITRQELHQIAGAPKWGPKLSES
jgi:UPF0176 protein